MRRINPPLENDGRDFVARFGLGIAFAGFVAFAVAGPVAAAESPKFEIDASWPTPMPKNWILGQIGGIFVDPKDDTITVVQGLNGTTVKTLIEGMPGLCRQLQPPAAPAQGGQAPQPTAPSGEQQTSLTGQQEIVILAVTPTQAEILKFAQLDGSITLVLRSAADFRDPTTGAPVVPAPSGSEGITLKKLTTDFAVPIPELVEAILPAQAKP